MKDWTAYSLDLRYLFVPVCTDNFPQLFATSNASALELPPDLWVSIMQIFCLNLIALLLILGAGLIAQTPRLCPGKFVPLDYLMFRVLIVVSALTLGTWSLEVMSEPPPLILRLARGFDLQRAGPYEMSAYLMAAVVSFKFTIWYSNGRKIVASRKWRNIKLSSPELGVLALAFALLFRGALIESYGIIQVSS